MQAVPQLSPSLVGRFRRCIDRCFDQGLGRLVRHLGGGKVRVVVRMTLVVAQVDDLVFGVRHGVIMRVFVFDTDLAARESVLHPPESGECAVDDEHPPAAQPKVPALAQQLQDDPDAEEHERYADDSTHHCIEPIGNCQPKGDCGRAEQEHDGTVANGVEHRQDKPAAPTLGIATQIGDRGDVIPVDAMTQPEPKRGEEKTDRHHLSSIAYASLLTTQRQVVSRELLKAMEPNACGGRISTMKRLITPLLFLLLLAACGSSSEVGTGSADTPVDDGDNVEDTDSNDVADGDEEPIPVEPDGGIGDGAGPIPLGDAADDAVITNNVIVDPRVTSPTELTLNPDDDTELWVRFVGSDPNCTAASVTVLTETPDEVAIELLVGITEDALSRSCMAGEFNLRVNVRLNESATGKTLNFSPGSADDTPVMVTPDLAVDDFVGLAIADAEALADESIITHRTVRVDDEFFAVTEDYNPGRLNFEVDDGVVSAVTLG